MPLQREASVRVRTCRDIRTLKRRERRAPGAQLEPASPVPIFLPEFFCRSSFCYFPSARRCRSRNSYATFRASSGKECGALG